MCWSIATEISHHFSNGERWEDNIGWDATRKRDGHRCFNRTEKRKAQAINQHVAKRWVPKSIQPWIASVAKWDSYQQESNPLAFFVRSRWTERASTRRMLLYRKTDSESSLAMQCIIDGGGIPRRRKLSYLGIKRNENKWPKISNPRCKTENRCRRFLWKHLNNPSPDVVGQ